LKKQLIQILKLALAAGLIYWLIRTEKITTEPFVRLWAIPWIIPFVFGLIFVLIVINNYRWLLLLQGQKINTSVKQTLPLTFIGMFFNFAMPGAVGGDVIKAYYIAQEQPGTKLRAVTSVLMDRIVGLYAMALIALFAVITNWGAITASANLRALALFVFVIVGVFTVFFGLGFSNRVRSHRVTHRLLKGLPGGRTLEKAYDAIHSFRNGKRQFLLGILLSVVVQSLNIICFYILARALHYEDVTLGSFFFIIPLGLIATAVPISPAGIGVGQAVFLALFTWYYGHSGSLGPTLITINQVVQAMLGLIGAYFYFMRKAPPAPQTAALE
jgi:glycosyltransferase 2 family protein